MKVKDLITQLQAYNPDHMVVVSGYEGGVEEAKSISEHTIALNCNESWYYGSHEIINKHDAHEGKERVQAVYIT
jgi:hypothetical protein